MVSSPNLLRWKETENETGSGTKRVLERIGYWNEADMIRRQRAELCVNLVAVVLFAAPTAAYAASTETSNGCTGTQADPCVRSGSCEIQGSTWTQDVTIDRVDQFDTQGWTGVCDMVHVGLVQGSCEPAGAQTDVTVHLSTSSFASAPAIVGPLACAGEPEPVPASSAIGRLLPGALLFVAALGRARSLPA